MFVILRLQFFLRRCFLPDSCFSFGCKVRGPKQTTSYTADLFYDHESKTVLRGTTTAQKISKVIKNYCQKRSGKVLIQSSTIVTSIYGKNNNFAGLCWFEVKKKNGPIWFPHLGGKSGGDPCADAGVGRGAASQDLLDQRHRGQLRLAEGGGFQPAVGWKALKKNEKKWTFRKVTIWFWITWLIIVMFVMDIELILIRYDASCM